MMQNKEWTLNPHKIPKDSVHFKKSFDKDNSQNIQYRETERKGGTQ